MNARGSRSNSFTTTYPQSTCAPIPTTQWWPCWWQPWRPRPRNTINKDVDVDADTDVVEDVEDEDMNVGVDVDDLEVEVKDVDVDEYVNDESTKFE